MIGHNLVVNKTKRSYQANHRPTTQAKDRYKLINWKEYNAGLCKRGSLTLWIAEPVLEVWEQIDASKKVVGEKLYPDSIILCCLTL